jgi:hypothetical protein
MICTRVSVTALGQKVEDVEMVKRAFPELYTFRSPAIAFVPDVLVTDSLGRLCQKRLDSAC